MKISDLGNASVGDNPLLVVNTTTNSLVLNGANYAPGINVSLVASTWYNTASLVRLTFNGTGTATIDGTGYDNNITLGLWSGTFNAASNMTIPIYVSNNKSIRVAYTETLSATLSF
jgi:hypothetical protein